MITEILIYILVAIMFFAIGFILGAMSYESEETRQRRIILKEAEERLLRKEPKSYDLAKPDSSKSVVVEITRDCNGEQKIEKQAELANWAECGCNYGLYRHKISCCLHRSDK
jgi:hypothetical protein